ncbi:MAG: hypothetical protein WAZ48_06350 [Lysobacteraceae bacterium]
MKPLSIRDHVRCSFAALLAFAAFGAAQAAESSAPAVSNTARMTDLQVRMMPFGAIFDTLASENPAWPMQEKPDAVTPKQLGCLRDQLSTPGYRRYKLAQVEAYVAANPSRVDAEIALLEEGAADLFGRLVTAGAESERSGIETDPATVLKDASPEQVLSFVTFFSDPNHAELRKLSGLGDALGIHKSAEENESAGEKIGSTMMMQIMLTAMSTCKVPTTVLFDK